MSIITSINGRQRKNEEVDEYEGLWINPGVYQAGEEGEEPVFVRLPRGIAISDLKPRKVYENMNPEFAAQVTLMNQMISAIQQKALQLEEGESVSINLECQLYRRQEEAKVAPEPEDSANLAAALFG